MNFCKADVFGHCSFKCLNCIYSNGEKGINHFKELWNEPLNKNNKNIKFNILVSPIPSAQF